MAERSEPLLLEGALVVALDEAGTVAERTVRVEEGRIAAVTAPGAPAPAGARRVDCGGRVLLPGLVNAHLHPELHLARGLLQGRTLHEWGACEPFGRALAFLSSPAGRGARRAATRAALAECLLGGVTAVGAYGVTDGAAADQAEELRALGLRGHVTIRDVAFGPARGLAVRHVYRLHAEETLTEAELAAAAAAHERGERVVIHVAETRWRVELCRTRFGTTPIRLLARWGLLSPRVLLSHAVHLDEEEIGLIARAGAPVLASPSAEMKLGDGVAPIPALLAAGALVALGTDAAVCNDAT
ncbi:MAG TPA: amidohydrolase family protein, partial [Longimicrobiales bacterium]|nr:amidohydrolase family protein [Longimicrobiales bacterium]